MKFLFAALALCVLAIAPPHSEAGGLRSRAFFARGGCGGNSAVAVANFGGYGGNAAFAQAGVGYGGGAAVFSRGGGCGFNQAAFIRQRSFGGCGFGAQAAFGYQQPMFIQAGAGYGFGASAAAFAGY